MEEINPRTIQTYPALKIFLSYTKLTKDQKDYVLSKITKQLIKDSKINSFPADFTDFYHYLLETIVEPLKKDVSKIYKSDSADKPSYITWQLNFLKGMSFVDAVLPLLEFQKFIHVIREEFRIDPKKLLNELGFSKDQLEKATYGGNSRKIDAVLRKLGEFDEIKERHQLVSKKLLFEKKFFSNYISKKEGASSKKSSLPIKRRERKLLIPLHQRVHVRNFILYGIATGNMFSLHGSNKGQRREWQRRILKDSEKKGYTPFLRNYLYYFFRVCGGKNIKRTNEALCDLGFPPTTHREHDHTMKRRYENLFLK